MKLCWVTNDKWYSKMYRWLFQEDASHMGIIFDLSDLTVAIDLNRPIGTLWDIRVWLNHYSIIHMMEIENITQEENLALFHACRDYAVGREYDINGYYWAMIAILRWRIFGGERHPKENPWASGTHSMCEEIVVPLAQTEVFRSHIGHWSVEGSDVKSLGDIRQEFLKLTEGNSRVKWTYNG